MQPETLLRNHWRRFLQQRKWHVEVFHNNEYQKGIPDLWLYHREHGYRWVDLKLPTSWELTRAQRRKWPEWQRAGIGVWILTSVTQDEYQKLFGPPNWRDYWKPIYDQHQQELGTLWNHLLTQYQE